MKRLLSIIITAILIISLSINSVYAAYTTQADTKAKIAANLYDDSVAGETRIIKNSTSKASFKKICLSDMANIFLSDPDVKNVKLSGNTLTYLLPDGTSGKIIETATSSGTITFEITEGNKSDSLTIDYINNESALNGKPLEITKTDADIYQSVSKSVQENTSLNTSNSTTWVKIGDTQYFDVYSDNQVRYTTTGVLVLILSSLVAFEAGILISAISIVIGYFTAQSSTSKYFYVSQALYYDFNLPDYHYLEDLTYYANPNFTLWITSSSKDILV